MELFLNSLPNKATMDNSNITFDNQTIAELTDLSIQQIEEIRLAM